MIKNILIYICLLVGISCREEAQKSALQVFSSLGYDSCRQLFSGVDGKIYLMGEWNLGAGQNTSLRVIQLDGQSEQMNWAAEWLKGENPQVIGIGQLPDGSLICAGDTGRPAPNSLRKMFFARMDQLGNFISEAEVKWTAPIFKGSKMAVSPNGQIYLAVHDAGAWAGKWQILMTDAQGNISQPPIQSPTLPLDLERYFCSIADIKTSPDGEDLYILSTLHGTDKMTKLEVHVGWICHFDKNGNLLQSKTVLKGLACRPASLVWQEGKVAITGVVANSSSQIEDVFCWIGTADLDSIGFSSSGGIREEGLFRDKLLVYAIPDAEGTIMTVALSKSYNLGNPLLLLSKFSFSGGSVISTGTLGGYLGEFSPAGIIKSADGFYWVAGTSNAWLSGKYNSDWVLFKSDALGNLID